MIKYLIYKFVVYFDYLIIVYVVMIGLFNIMQMLMALVHSVMYIKKAKFSDIRLYEESDNMVPISILVPAHNEDKTVVETIKSLLALEFSTYEIIIINDGSTDTTLQSIIEAFELNEITFPAKISIETKPVRGVYYNPEYPKIWLIDKENGGKADALNAGINIAHYPYFVSLDADSLLNSDSLVRIALAFMENRYTVAVGGIIRVANGSEIKNGKVIKLNLPKNRFAMFQIVEYMRAFLVGRVGWSILNTILIISGAFGAFKKDVAIKVGGYTTNTVGEDMDIVIKLHKYMSEKKYKYKITFLPDPICWTQVPESFRDLYRQRRRWQIGLMDALKRNKVMMLNFKYGISGMLAMPYFFLFELAAPMIEAIGWIVIPLSYFLGILSFKFFVTYFLAATVFGVILSIGSLIIEEFTLNKYTKLRDFFRLCLYSVIENFSYRQLTVMFRVIGILGFKKYQHSWDSLKRKKFAEKGQAAG